MSMTKQLSLPGFESLQGNDNECPKRRRDTWYYVANTRTQTMLIIGTSGEFLWVEHDTINDTPHLFNDKYEALRVSKKHGSNTVLKYKWEVK